MFGKVFASMYEGSMMGQGPETFAVWTYIIANSDLEGFIELNPKIIGFKIGMSEGAVAEVLDKFLEPDSRSRTKEQQGRKLEKLGEYLYRIINYEKYRAMRNAEVRRESNRVASAKYRAKHKGLVRHKPLAGEVEAIKGYNEGRLDENFQPIKG